MKSKLGEVEYSGSFYNLEFHVDALTTSQIRELMVAFWSQQGLDGCYLDNTRAAAAQERLTPELAAVQSRTTVYGNATLPDGHIVACGCDFWGPEDQPDFAAMFASGVTVCAADLEFPCHFSLNIPDVALNRIYRAHAYDHVDYHRPWREPLENWLALIASGVFAKIPDLPVNYAQIGWQIIDLNRELFKNADRLSSFNPPAERAYAYVCRSQAALRYFPTTRWDLGCMQS